MTDRAEAAEREVAALKARVEEEKKRVLKWRAVAASAIGNTTRCNQNFSATCDNCQVWKEWDEAMRTEPAPAVEEAKPDA